MKAIGKKSIDFTNGVLNYILLTVIVIVIAFAGYALWDSSQIYQAANKSQYALYKPTIENQGKSFRELQALNAEVFSWLSVYGTNIDYPVVQGPDNMKYVNTNAEGLYSLSGAIFLDYANNKDFSDFNSILYGHHMAKRVMFGEIGDFSSKDVFEANRYGNLYFDGKDHGIEFFAFLHADAYDSSVFSANIKEEKRQEYLDNLLDKAIYTRDIGVGIDDHIVLLSTCSSDSTNGRDILVGRIAKTTFEPHEPAAEIVALSYSQIPQGEDCEVAEIPLRLIVALLLSVPLAVKIIDLALNKRRQKNKEQ
ncbi:MAG: class B sortase [Oscillospiraceae bacterium]|nr:class B sortase [Oscillospiraceae bacterium]